MTDLRKLIEAVEAGNRAAALEHADAVPTRQWQHLMDAMGGSLDAAKALFDAVLPPREYLWHVSHEVNFDGFVCSIFGCKQDRYVATNHSQDPARAWLLCILKAKEAQQ